MDGQIAVGVILAAICSAIAATYLVQGRPRRRSRTLAALERARRPDPRRQRIEAVLGRWRLVQQIRRARRRRSLQRVSADLRRLRRVLAADHNDSAVHQFAHKIAYDQLMIEACVMLCLDHGLGPEVTGSDREIERYRTEANLQAAGVMLLPRIHEPLD